MQEVERIEARVRLLWKVGTSEEALGLLQPALHRHPHAGNLHELAGRIHARAGEVEKATRRLEQATLLAPLSVAGQLALVDCYLYQQFPLAARAILDGLAERGNLTCTEWGKVARGFATLGDVKQASDTCRVAAAQHPDRDEPLYGLAFYMLRLGCPPHAVLPVVERAYELDPQCILYRKLLASLLDRTGAHQRAYRMLSTLSPDEVVGGTCPGMLQRFLWILSRAGDYERAHLCWSRLRQLGYQPPRQKADPGA